MDDPNQTTNPKKEASQKIKAVFDETVEKVAVIEREQEKIFAAYIKKLEQEKIDQIKKTLEE
jgi:hypothetical protein